jgi:hypothetical protein
MSRTAPRLVAAAAVVIVGILGVAAYTLLGGVATPATAAAAPRYVEEAVAAGIDHTFGGEETWYVGGGVAVFDCDDDHRPDLYIAGGEGPALLARNDSAVGGELRFAPVHDAATDLADVTGAYPLDIDGDAVTDLAVLRIGETVLLRGLGDCRFERGNEAWSFDGGDGWATAFSATWEGAATMPTLALGRYLVVERADDGRTECDKNSLLRPAATGTSYDRPIPLDPGLCPLSMLFSDWDRSGRRDLRVSNDRHYYRDGQEQLWRIEAGQAPREYTDLDGWARLEIWGMGIASQDLTGDGYPEVFLTSQGENKLQTLAEGPQKPRYRDIALRRGVTVQVPFAGDTTLPSTAWHPQFDDVNNDGFIDLFVAKGNVTAMADFALRDPSNLLLGQPDGTYIEGAEKAGITSFDRGRGAAVADFNLDGLLDLVEVNFGAPVRLWRNTGTGGNGSGAGGSGAGHWLGLRLSQPGPNRDAIGAWVEAKVGEMTVSREVMVGGGHVSGALGPMHFGLGPADRAEIRVTWPDGEVGPWTTVEGDQYVSLDRGIGTATPWPAP